jgi:hypothetical protein
MSDHYMSNPRWLGLTCLLDPSRLGLACVLNPTILDLAWLSTPRYLGLGWFNWKERKYYFNKKITWTLDNLMIQGLTTMIKDFVTPIKLLCKNKFSNRISKNFLSYFSNWKFFKTSVTARFPDPWPAHRQSSPPRCHTYANPNLHTNLSIK